MAQITITIPDQHVDRVIHALCTDPVYGLVAEETAANAKARLVEYIKERVKQVEEEEARQAITPPDTTGIAS